MVRPTSAKKRKKDEDGYADTSGSPSSSSDEEDRRKKSPRKTPRKSPKKTVPKGKKKDTGKVSKKKNPDRSTVRSPQRPSGKEPSKGSTPKKPERRYRPLSKTLKEIQHYQSTTDLLILRAPFARLVREITQDLGVQDIRYRTSALEALQVAAEYYLIGLFEDSYLLTKHRNRVTLSEKDILLAKRIRGRDE